MLPTTARSWTKLLVGQTTESRKIGCKYLLFKFLEMKKLQLSRNCSLYTTPIACKRGRYISIVLQLLQNGSICLILPSLQPKVLLNVLKLSCFYPKLYFQINNIFQIFSSWNLRTGLENTSIQNCLITSKVAYSIYQNGSNPHFFVLLHCYSVCIWPGIKQFLCQCVPIYAGQWGSISRRYPPQLGGKW